MSKYFAKRTPCKQGHTHASRREAVRCGELFMLLRAGQISALVIEPQYWFHIEGEVVKHSNGRRVGYKPDFGYIENGKHVVEDIKSGPTMTEAATLRMALFRHLFPDIELRVVL